MDAALRLSKSVPAAGPLRLARRHRSGARPAPDRGIAALEQGVRRDCVGGDVVVDLVAAPARQRVDLQDLVSRWEQLCLDDGGLCTQRRLIATQARDPPVVFLEGVLQRSDLVDEAAPIWIPLVELRAVDLGLALRRAVITPQLHELQVPQVPDAFLEL